MSMGITTPDWLPWYMAALPYGLGSSRKHTTEIVWIMVQDYGQG